MAGVGADEPMQRDRAPKRALSRKGSFGADREGGRAVSRH